MAIPRTAACRSRRSCGQCSVRDSRLSTGCTICCGNVDYSKSANSDFFLVRPPCTDLACPLDCQLRQARRGSRSKQSR
jgi:hypothetical protein